MYCLCGIRRWLRRISMKVLGLALHFNYNKWSAWRSCNSCTRRTHCKDDRIDSVKAMDTKAKKKTKKPNWPFSELRINVVWFRSKCAMTYSTWRLGKKVGWIFFFSYIHSIFLAVDWVKTWTPGSKERKRLQNTSNPMSKLSDPV